MTNSEILLRAIQKAKKNGLETGMGIEDIEEILIFNKIMIPSVYYWLIFNHEFVKAFWGEGFKKADYEKYGSEVVNLYFYRWQLHLTSLVLEKEPLKYIEKFLDE